MPCDPSMVRRKAPTAPKRTRVRLTILVKLLVAFVAPTVALFFLFAAVAHEVARGDLESELGTRLAAVASTAALQVRGKYLVPLAPGDEEDRGYQNALRKLEALADATGARIYVFDREFNSRVDTRRATPIGTHYFQAELDRLELDQVFESGRAVSSVLFQGGEGRYYKAGYAPVRASETEDEIVLALGVEAPAAYFDRLAEFRRQLVVYGVLLVFVILGISLVVAALITRPVRQLAAAAERIGRGDLDAPVVQSSRDELGVLASTMDTMRSQLRARDERMQLMLSGIAHEVRNPLGGIELFVGILREELPADDQRQSHVLRIERELGYLNRVVNEFLDYARQAPLECDEFNLDELMAELVELEAGESLAQSVPVHLADECDEDLSNRRPHLVWADRAQVRRAILNLIRNAIQASRGVEAPSVILRASTIAGGVAVSVSNRGEPVPSDAREKIFDPFFTTRQKGTGLGLAFVRETARRHGGDVSLLCEGFVTTFVMRIPDKGACLPAEGAPDEPARG